MFRRPRVVSAFAIFYCYAESDWCARIRQRYARDLKLARFRPLCPCFFRLTSGLGRSFNISVPFGQHRYRHLSPSPGFISAQLVMDCGVPLLVSEAQNTLRSLPPLDDLLRNNHHSKACGHKHDGQNWRSDAAAREFFLDNYVIACRTNTLLPWDMYVQR